MTQNTALSLISAIVIAVGLLVGWCAGALELAPDRLRTGAATDAAERAIAPGGSGRQARLPGFVRNRTDRPDVQP